MKILLTFHPQSVFLALKIKSFLYSRHKIFPEGMSIYKCEIPRCNFVTGSKILYGRHVLTHSKVAGVLISSSRCAMITAQINVSPYETVIQKASCVSTNMKCVFVTIIVFLSLLIFSGAWNPHNFLLDNF